jgi:NADH-quinone oxidoreductase subunit J
MNSHYRRRTSQASRATGKALAALVTIAIGLLLAVVVWAQPDKSYAVPGVSTRPGPEYLWAFYIIGGLTLLGAVATVTRRNPVVAAMCLVWTLAGSAGIYVLLHATFLAAMQVLVYAGAIMVLFVFVIMSVERPEEEEVGLGRSLGTKLIGLVALGLLCARLIPIVRGSEVRTAQQLVPDAFGTVTSIGKLLFSNYLFPFEAISILLLVAIVGAVVISRRRTRIKPQPDGESTEGGS